MTYNRDEIHARLYDNYKEIYPKLLSYDWKFNTEVAEEKNEMNKATQLIKNFYSPEFVSDETFSYEGIRNVSMSFFRK